MVSEIDLSQEYSAHFSHQCELMSNVFSRRRISVHPIEKKQDVFPFISQFIASHNINSIGFSDSVSLHECDVFSDIYKTFSNTKTIINPFERAADGWYKTLGEERDLNGSVNLPRDEYYKRMSFVVDKMRQALLSDLFIVGANAITLTGEIVSIDGSGNRVAGMLFGPKHVVVVVGRNKICCNLDEALTRIRNVSAPLNYIRHINKHHNKYEELPCVTRGKCFDCSHPRSACKKIVIMRGEVEINADRTHLLVVNDNLGF